MNTSNEELCTGIDKKLYFMLEDIQLLKFDEEPDYISYINYFEEILANNKIR